VHDEVSLVLARRVRTLRARTRARAHAAAPTGPRPGSGWPARHADPVAGVHAVRVGRHLLRRLLDRRCDRGGAPVAQGASRPTNGCRW